VHLDDVDVEDEFGFSCDQHYDDNYIMADEEEDVDVDEDATHLHMDGDFLFPSALDYIDQHNVYDQLHSCTAKQFELHANRRHANRKPCRRKWPALQVASQLPLESRVDCETRRRRCSRLLNGVLERTQLEMQRLRSESLN